MLVYVEIEGLNLEKLLRAAAEAGIPLRDVRRVGARTMRARVSAMHLKALRLLCERYGWVVREREAGLLVGAGRFLLRRCMLAVGAALCVLTVYAASHLLLAVETLHAGAYAAAVREELAAAGAVPGRPKSMISTDALRGRLEYALPGLSFVGVRFAGSTLIVDCREAREGEQAAVPGQGMDIVAGEAGIVTRIWASSGTPQVRPGQAVRAGQVLISGQARTGGGATRPVRAEGQVTARVFARGDARVSLWETRTVETGETRRRVTLFAPWGERVVREAEPFDTQDVSARIEPIVGLYLPAYRRIETFAATQVFRSRRKESDARSMAQGAAEEIAKKQCPTGTEPLDKWTEYSMIDNEFVYATVVIEYERDIARRSP